MDSTENEVGNPRAISVEEFERDCLRLMDEVCTSGVALIITRDGQPIVRLSPAEATPFVGRSAGEIYASAEDLIAPIGEDWEADSDL